MEGIHGMVGSIPLEVNLAADEWMAKLTESQRAAKEVMQRVAVAMKKSYNMGKHPGHEYSKGNLVGWTPGT